MSKLDRVRRQLRWTFLVLVVGALAFGARLAAAPTETAGGSGWGWSQLITPANLLSLGVLVFHFGSLRQQLADMRAELKEIPETYARQDVMRIELAALKRRFDDRRSGAR